MVRQAPVQGLPNQYPPPPPRKGLSGLVIALIAVGCLGVLGLVALFAAGIAIGYQREIARSKAAKVDPMTVSLSEQHATTNGLLSAHYPADFAAKSLDAATLLISRNLGGVADEGLTLAAVSNPITDDPHEFARILWAAHDKNVTAKGGTSTKTVDHPTKCLGKYDGVEWEGTFSLPLGEQYRSKGCFFIRGDRGYALRYDLPGTSYASDAPLLDRIIEATELAP